MSDRIETRKEHPRSSRDRYRRFVEDYKHQRLDDSEDANEGKKPADNSPKAGADILTSALARRRSTLWRVRLAHAMS